MTTKKAPAKKTLKDFAEKVAKKVTHQKVEATTPDEVVNGADEPAVTVTVVEPIQVESDMAVVTPNYNVDLANVRTVIPVVRDAWNSVKGPDDAPFEACDSAFKGILLQHALDLFRTSQVLSGDSSLARFEQAVAKIKSGGN